MKQARIERTGLQGLTLDRPVRDLEDIMIRSSAGRHLGTPGALPARFATRRIDVGRSSLSVGARTPQSRRPTLATKDAARADGSAMIEPAATEPRTR